jgi:hypothetical protein
MLKSKTYRNFDKLFDFLKYLGSTEPVVRAEANKLKRKELAILDETLATRKEAGLSQAQITKPMAI